jgi:SAM-dependent methyltransferase
MSRVALRDTIRSSPLGPWVRSFFVTPYRRYELRARARRMAKVDPSRFTCSVCDYHGLFVDYPVRGTASDRKASRQYALCPGCGAGERHRLQANVLATLLPEIGGGSKSALHFAPEGFLASKLKTSFETYRTSDLFRRDVDIQADMTNLPIADSSFDLIYASHVLEHVPDDEKAIAELHRVLKPGGVAILPVPIYSDGDHSTEHTVEYGRAVAEEDGHVRAPGLDYFNRYSRVFGKVRIYSSEEFKSSPVDNQLYIRKCVDHLIPRFIKLPDYVPVCYKVQT